MFIAHNFPRHYFLTCTHTQIQCEEQHVQIISISYSSLVPCNRQLLKSNGGLLEVEVGMTALLIFVFDVELPCGNSQDAVCCLAELLM